MLRTEGCCEAAPLDALLFSRINYAVKPHAVAELAGTGVCWGVPYAAAPLLASAQPQIFAAFPFSLWLEAESGGEAAAGVAWPTAIALAGPCVPGSGGHGGHRDGNGVLEGGLDLLGGPADLCRFSKMYF